MKRCHHCGEDRPFFQFGATTATEDGHHIYCWPCRVDRPGLDSARCQVCEETKKLRSFPGMDAEKPCNACQRTLRPEGRRCSACQITKPASEFHRNATTPDGLAAQCKVCARTRYDLSKPTCSDCGKRKPKKSLDTTGRCKQCRRKEGLAAPSGPNVTPEQFKTWRLNCGLSLRRAGTILSVSHVMVLAYERGDAPVPEVQAWAMAAVLAGLQPIGNRTRSDAISMAVHP